MGGTLFTEISVFDGTGAGIFPGEVLVEDDRITAVGRGRGQIDRQRASEVIDGRGATLMPGLIEPHSHLTFPSSIDRRVAKFMPSVEKHAYKTAHNAKTLLDHGFTSSFSGGATRPAVEVTLRDEIAAGFLPGPRMTASSFERNVDGKGSGYNQGVEQVESFCKEMIGLGVDSMKFILSGESSVLPANFDKLTYSAPELEAASHIAHEAGVNLLGHAYDSESIRLAMRFGFHCIYHCNFADEPTLDLMAENKDKFFVVPAVGVIVAGIRNRDEMTPEALELKDEAQLGLHQIYEAQLRVLPAMRERGIRVLPGGDYGFPHNPIGRNAWDMELFVKEFGFTSTEVLVAATQLGAGVMRMSDRLGLVKENFLADLLLIDGNPVEDITILQDPNRIQVIMQEGKFYKREFPTDRVPATAT